MRTHFASLALLLTGLSSAQEAKPVTLSCGGARLQEAIRLLAEASQTKLVVSPALANSEIVVIRVKEAPLNELMKRIAITTSGRWVKSGETWMLEADTQARSAQALARKKHRLASFQEQIKTELNPPKPEEGQAQEMIGFMGGGDLAVTKIVASLDLASLVDLPEDGRVVYSTMPNRSQRAMRLSPAVIQELVVAHNKEAAEQSAEETTTDPDALKMREYMERFGMGRRRKPIKEEPYKAILVVERGGMISGGDNLQATLRLYSNQGNVLLSRSATYYLGGMGTLPVPAEVPTEDPEEKPKPEPQSPKIEWSPVSKELQTRLSQGPMSGGSGGPTKPWSEAAREALSNIDRVEPLQYLIGDGLVQVAIWKNANLVASLPDQVAETISNGGQSATCAALLKWAENTESLSQTMEGGWWSISPKDPIGAREARFDRLALAPLGKKAMAGGNLNVDDLANYALKSPPPMTTPLGAMMLFALEPSVIRLAFLPDAWDYLRLWATLTPQQKMPTGGTRLSFAGLTPNQTSIVTRIIFGAMPSFQVGPDPADMDALGMFGTMMTMGLGESGRQDNDYKEEPTELLPDGLPGAGFIQIQIKADIALKASGSQSGEMDWMSMFGSLGVEDLAMYKFMEEKAGAMVGAEGMPRIDRVTLGKRTDIVVELHVAEGVKTRYRFADDTFDKDAKPVSVEGLSAEIRARIDKAVELIKKSNLPFFDPGMFGRPPGPPPAR